ncbi:MAG TPA: cation:proton antiporter [Aggregatilineales bacterium]|nr:cation:proton antiporter [Aggregatilineales bacterium]
MTLEDIGLYLVLPIIGLSVLMGFYRLLVGPSLPDRVVALDLMTTLGIGIIAFVAILTDQSVFLDVAVVLALTSFLGTIAFAYYIEQRNVQ